MRWLPWLLVVGACIAPSSGERVISAEPLLPGTTTTTEASIPVTTRKLAPPATAPMAPPPGVEVLVATTPDELGAISEALYVAVDRWGKTAPETYAYRIRIDCDCPDRGTTWVRVFDPDWPDDVPLDVDVIHARIHGALETLPERVELAVDAQGLPVWFAAHGDSAEAFLIEEFHEISRAAGQFDGQWRFTGGELDGRPFGNPTTGLIIATLREGSLTYPIDCNEAGGPVDIHGAHFGIGPVYTTLAGCMGESDEGRLFSEAVQEATTIGMVGPQLVLSGEDGLVRLVPLEQPELRGELPLTAAGETLILEAGTDDLSSVFTVSPGLRDSRFGAHPGRSISHTLTAVAPGADTNAEWAPWSGEFDVPANSPGPREILIPHDIGVGDYQLCSPYWNGDFFCYDLLVRPASAPWFVTAGADGVVLHDADGTSDRSGKRQPALPSGSRIDSSWSPSRERFWRSTERDHP